jgi:hypothetical protein
MSSIPPPPPPPFRPAPPPPPPMPPPPPSSGGGAGDFDLARALKFFFEDPDWVRKIAFGGLFALLTALLVGIPMVGGYYMRLTRNSYKGDERPLPDWDDMGGIFSEGLRFTGVALAYSLGVMMPLWCVMGLIIFGMGTLGSHGGSGSDALGGLAALAMMGVYGLFFLAGIGLTVYLPAALTRFTLADGDFGVAFQFGENVAFIKRNLGPYLMAVLAYFIASFASQFGIILCCIGVFPLAFWSYCVMAWSMGQVARRDPQLAAGLRR